MLSKINVTRNDLVTTIVDYIKEKKKQRKDAKYIKGRQFSNINN